MRSFCSGSSPAPDWRGDSGARRLFLLAIFFAEVAVGSRTLAISIATVRTTVHAIDAVERVGESQRANSAKKIASRKRATRPWSLHAQTGAGDDPDTR